MIETIKDIEEVVKTVLFRSRELSKRIAELEAQKAALEAQNAALEAEAAELRTRLSRFEKPVKDSHNSSTPPSKESLKAQAVRRTRSLLVPGGRPTGGQKGHKGTTLLMNDTPDVILSHMPEYCSNFQRRKKMLPAGEKK